MKKQELVYLVRIEHKGEFSYAIQSFTNGEWCNRYQAECPPDLLGALQNKLLRDFGAEVRRIFVKEDQELLFGKEPPVIAAASFGKQLRQFFPLSKKEQSFFFEGFSV